MGKNLCPVCDSKNFVSYLQACATHGNKVLNRKKTFEYFLCRDCGCLFLRGITINDRFYDVNYNFPDSRKTGYLKKLENFFIDFSIGRKKKLILKYMKRHGGRIGILDVGCGDGRFLLDLDERLFDKYGIELESRLNEKSRLNIIKGNFLEYNFGKKKFDIITFWHSLEHMQTPLSAITRAKKLLNKNGKIIISVPNGSSLGFLLVKDKWFHLDAPRHLVIFNEKSLSILCSRAGLKIIKKTNLFYEFPLDLFWSVSNQPLSSKIFVYLFYPIIKLIDPETLTFICKRDENTKDMLVKKGLVRLKFYNWERSAKLLDNLISLLVRN